MGDHPGLPGLFRLPLQTFRFDAIQASTAALAEGEARMYSSRLEGYLAGYSIDPGTDWSEGVRYWGTPLELLEVGAIREGEVLISYTDYVRYFGALLYDIVADDKLKNQDRNIRDLLMAMAALSIAASSEATGAAAVAAAQYQTFSEFATLEAFANVSAVSVATEAEGEIESDAIEAGTIALAGVG